MKKCFLVACTLSLLCGGVLKANVKLGSLFCDHMVLQREMAIPVWGTAKAGEPVTVVLAGKKQQTVTGADGKWMVRVPKMKAGGPYVLSVQGENKLEVTDVYVGEVWLCSGQSNMDMTVAKEDRYWCGVMNEEQEVASANFPLIRVFDTEYSPRETPKAEVSGKWEICSPKTVGHFSAAAYFFAREIYSKYKIPVGLVTTAYGASTAEAWTSREALMAHPNLRFLLDNFKQKTDKFSADSAVTMANYRAALSKWTGDISRAQAEAGDVTAAKDKKTPKRPGNPSPWVDQHNPYVLYNGMVAPLVPYAIRGALWYQGESNGPSAKQYREIMETLIADWRKAWGLGNFPFIYVQLANHQALIEQPVKDDPMVFVREAQLQNLSVPNTAMVVAIDNADASNPGNIHPKNKQEIGRRLALAAIGIAYKERITCMGPIYDKMKVENNAVRIYFKSTGKGLKVKDSNSELAGFAIAGPDKKFVKAKATIEGNTIVVSEPSVTKPAAVRYGWGKNPPVNLYNAEGLPASPFRTDNW